MQRVTIYQLFLCSLLMSGVLLASDHDAADRISAEIQKITLPGAMALSVQKDIQEGSSLARWETLRNLKEPAAPREFQEPSSARKGTFFRGLLSFLMCHCQKDIQQPVPKDVFMTRSDSLRSDVASIDKRTSLTPPPDRLHEEVESVFLPQDTNIKRPLTPYPSKSIQKIVFKQLVEGSVVHHEFEESVI